MAVSAHAAFFGHADTHPCILNCTGACTLPASPGVLYEIDAELIGETSFLGGGLSLFLHRLPILLCRWEHNTGTGAPARMRRSFSITSASPSCRGLPSDRSAGLQGDTGGWCTQILASSAGKKYYSLILQDLSSPPIADRGLPFSG
jgi:hypothetical protein